MHSTQQLFCLKGKTALITGSSRGLGLQIAEALGEQGARVQLSARKADELSAAVTHLGDQGIEADWIAADGALDTDIITLVDGALAKLGHVDILVNNAGATWGAHNITVNALAPGFFPSKMTHGSIADRGLEAMCATVPLGRLGDDEDLKGAALLFATDAGKHITGQILAVDGGAGSV